MSSRERIIRTELTDDDCLLVTKEVTTEITTKYRLVPAENDNNNHVEHLTPRELQVLELIAAGYTNGEIADKFVLSVRTAESHRSNLMGKLDLHTRWELVKYWKENYEK